LTLGRFFLCTLSPGRANSPQDVLLSRSELTPCPWVSLSMNLYSFHVEWKGEQQCRPALPGGAVLWSADETAFKYVAGAALRPHPNAWPAKRHFKQPRLCLLPFTYSTASPLVEMLFSALRCLAHLSLFVSLSAAASISRRATTCNGHAELCNRSYGNITFVGTCEHETIRVWSS
jgi:hypothetical protein